MEITYHATVTSKHNGALPFNTTILPFLVHSGVRARECLSGVRARECLSARTRERERERERERYVVYMRIKNLCH